MLLSREAFRRLCVARELLRERPRPSIADIARLVGVSRFHFIRQFTAVFGLTPHQFGINARLEHAKRLLANTQQSVTDVCLEVGCSSLGSFSAMFQRRVGESPSAYRDRLRRDHAGPHARSAALEPGCLSLMGGLAASSTVSSRRNFQEANHRGNP